MTHLDRETSPRSLARLAGFLALATLVLGTFAGSVNSRIVVPGDAAATAGNIQASGALFRVALVSLLAMYTVFIFYALLLYRLLRPAGRHLALMMLVLGLSGVPIAMLSQAPQAAALHLLSGGEGLGGIPAGQVPAQVMLLLRLTTQGNIIGAVFWGLWLFPLGLLVYRSGFLPRILGVLLMIGCFGWLAVVIQRFLLPGHPALASARYAAHVAELSWLLWLLIRGVDTDRWRERAAAAPAA